MGTSFSYHFSFPALGNLFSFPGCFQYGGSAADGIRTARSDHLHSRIRQRSGQRPVHCTMTARSDRHKERAMFCPPRGIHTWPVRIQFTGVIRPMLMLSSASQAPEPFPASVRSNLLLFQMLYHQQSVFSQSLYFCVLRLRFAYLPLPYTWQ